MGFFAHTTACNMLDFRGSHIVEGTCLCSYWWVYGLYLNHSFIIVVTFWSSSTYNPHINNNGQDSLTKNILGSSFDPDLSRLVLARTELLHNILKTTAVLFAIKTTKQSHIKSCLRWLPATLDQSQVMLSSLSRRSCLSWPVSFACSSPNHRHRHQQ